MKLKQKKTVLDELLENPETARVLAQEKFIQEVEEKLLEWMEQRGMSQSDLAKKLGKTRSYLSQLFSGSRNLTLRTVADICWALEVTPQFSKEPTERVNGDPLQ